MKLHTVGGMALAATLAAGAPAFAQSSEPFLGSLHWTSSTYCPRGFALANGQILPINQNQALFSLLGTTFGGDGRVNFALPDLRGRTMIGTSDGASGISERFLGEVTGAQATALATSNLPPHNHSATSSVTMRANSGPASAGSPTGAVFANGRLVRLYSTAAPDVDLDSTAVSASTSLAATGGSQPFENRQPLATLNACIALVGVFPSRN